MFIVRNFTPIMKVNDDGDISFLDIYEGKASKIFSFRYSLLLL